MKLTNYLPVSRELQKHWIYKDSDYLHCWMEMLLNARFGQEPKTDMYKGVLYTICRGEFLYSRPTFSERLKITDGKLRTLLKLLIKDGMIEQVKSLGTNKPTIYKICNYETYNAQPSEDVDTPSVDDVNDQVRTKSEPSGNQVGTNKQPLKNNGNKVKKEKNVFTPPLFSEVEDHVIEKGYAINPKGFFDYYDASNWIKADGSPVLNWKQTTTTWNTKELKKNPNARPYEKKQPVEKSLPAHMISFIPEDQDD